MAGVECGCGLGQGPAAQEELLLFRNPGEPRCGTAGIRDPGNPGDGVTAVCFLYLLKLLPSVNAPAVWGCAEPAPVDQKEVYVAAAALFALQQCILAGWSSLALLQCC